MLNWKEEFKAGSIIAYLNRPRNAPHHTTDTGKWIQYAQSFDSTVDSSITHVGIIRGMVDETPEPGYTQMHIIDTLYGASVGDRRVERNYAIEVYRLKSGLVLHDSPRITSESLMQKALEIAIQLEGMPYDRLTLLRIALFSNERRAPDHEYTKWLCTRFKVDSTNGTIDPDKARDTIVCPALVLVCYQLAFILMAGEEATKRQLPEFLNYSAHCTVAGLVKFLRENEYFEPVHPNHTHALTYSGTPHPNDPSPPSSPEPLGYRLVRLSIPTPPRDSTRSASSSSHKSQAKQ